MADPTGDERWMQPPRDARDPAAAAAAEVSAILRAGEAPARGRRRAALGLAAAVAVAGALGLWLAARRAPPRGVAMSVDGGQLLAPLEASRDASTGEEVVPFDGFAVSVETDPPGALVTVGGVPRGEAPVFAGVDCAPGEEVEIRAATPGRVPAVRATRCRAGALVKVRLRLAGAAR